LHSNFVKAYIRPCIKQFYVMNIMKKIPQSCVSYDLSQIPLFVCEALEKL